MNKFFTICLAIFSLHSCAPAKITSSNSNNTEIYPTGVVQLPVVAELKVEDKKSSSSVNPPKGTSLEEAKTLAIREILKKTSGDILVQPTVEYEIVKRRITMTVTGYSGTYFNFHQMTKEEVPLFEAGILQEPAVTQPFQMMSKKMDRKKLAIGAGSIIATGGILAFLLIFIF